MIIINRFRRLSRFCFQGSLTKRGVQYNQHCSRNFILGIETSCDDTGCAIIKEDGVLVADRLYSQNLMHLRNGGIIPDVAQDLHRDHIESIVKQTLNDANLNMDSICAIAVTVEPGLPLSLVVGMKYAKHLSRKFNKPVIPIHHMEAHALVARMKYNIPFPFLTLLISGGHCLLAVAQDVNKFLLLGQSIDLAPGELFDKIARRMKLRNILEYSQLSGGQAIEKAALKAKNPNEFQLPLPLADRKDCNFSFNGLKTSIIYHIVKKEKLHEISANKLIPEVYDLCGAALLATSRHLIHRTQRAMEFCSQKKLIPDDNKQLVVSGGVACNNYIFNTLSVLCKEFDYNIHRPPPKLCTDNGVMIAWNGLEKWQKGIDIITNINTIDIKAVSPLGENFIDDVAESRIPMKLLKIKMSL